jgi:hypothetical protein
MKTLVTLFLLPFLSACSVYKIEKVHNYKPRLQDKPLSKKAPSEPLRLNSYMEGAQCFEPMLYVISLGIIPSHCVAYYQAGAGVFRVTTMIGWIPSVYPAFSDWEYDFDGEGQLRSLKQLSEQGVDPNWR